MTDDERIAACEANFIESWRELAYGSGIQYEDDGVIIAGPGFGPAWLNSVFITHPFSDAKSQLVRAFELLDAKHVPFFVRIRAGLDESTERTLLETFGLRYHDSVPGMALGPIPPTGERQTPLEIRKVDDDSSFSDFVGVTAASYGFDSQLASRLLPAQLRREPRSHFFVGYIDGKPVAASELIVLGEAAGVNLIGTIEGFRGRGFGEAVTWQVVRAGEQAGCRFAVLQSSGMGRPVYERMGFRVVCEHKTFVRAGVA